MKSAEELGDILRQARTGRRLELTQLSEQTGLPQKYLEALESGAHDALPGRAYARIYYLNYARALGLDTEGLMLEWPQPRPTETAHRAPSSGRPRLWLYLVPLCAGIAVVAWFTQRPRPQDAGVVTAESAPPQASPAGTGAAPVERPATAPEDGLAVAPEDGLAAAPDEGPAPPVAAVEPPVRVLEVSVRAPSWVVLEADGDTVHARLLPGGGRIRAEARRLFVLTAARPEAVTALLDGVALDLPVDPPRPLVRHRIDLRHEGEER